MPISEIVHTNPIIWLNLTPSAIQVIGPSSVEANVLQ